MHLLIVGYTVVAKIDHGISSIIKKNWAEEMSVKLCTL